MPIVTVMGWNIENFGANKYNAQAGGAELLDLIAAVIVETGADIVALSEMRSNLGATIGTDLVNRLNALTTSTWRRQASIQFGNNRWEQYTFVWDRSVVQLYNAPNSFQYQYQNQNPPPNLIGFPLQTTSDRPPYLGYFQTRANPQKNILVAIFHAPAPTPWAHVRNGVQRLADVQGFLNDGDTCVIMGDFNIRASNDAADPNSYGGQAFGNLVAAGFQQRLTNVESSLIKRNQAFTGMIIGDCYSQPYDNIFFRNNANGLTISDDGMEELISECMNNNYLETYLTAIDGVNMGMAPAGYATVEDAFQSFRYYVSDHMPVVANVNF